MTSEQIIQKLREALEDLYNCHEDGGYVRPNDDVLEVARKALALASPQPAPSADCMGELPVGYDRGPWPEPAAFEPSDDMVNRFLTYKLPDSVCSDKCVCDPEYANKFPGLRSGTNLLTAIEAKQMLAHVLAIDAPRIATDARRKALEEAACIAAEYEGKLHPCGDLSDEYRRGFDNGNLETCFSIAFAIRALEGKP